MADLKPISGLTLAGVATGLKAEGERDLCLVSLPPQTTMAGTFTQSQCPAAPVQWCRHILGQGEARGIVINAGNANAFTGPDGDALVQATATGAAELLDCQAEQIFIASTGVIGVPMAAQSIAERLAQAHQALRADAWHEAADAIRTTDTYAKLATTQVTINGQKVTIQGFAKGSGMIAPNMATMLAFVFTDAAIPQASLQAMLRRGVDLSFNSITVDSDTSTNDTVLLAATGEKDLATEDDQQRFEVTLIDVLQDLAKQIVCDGEGAQKLIEVQVQSTKSEQEARCVAQSVANSPLVKTAIAGSDANWGRIVMAIGKAPVSFDVNTVSIFINDHCVAKKGSPQAYDEPELEQSMQGTHIILRIDLAQGQQQARVWTCDLTHQYIAINADYRS